MHSHEGNITENAQDIYQLYEFENYEFTFTTASIKGLWVNFSKAQFSQDLVGHFENGAPSTKLDSQLLMAKANLKKI